MKQSKTIPNDPLATSCLSVDAKSILSAAQTTTTEAALNFLFFLSNSFNLSRNLLALLSKYINLPLHMASIARHHCYYPELLYDRLTCLPAPTFAPLSECSQFNSKVILWNHNLQITPHVTQRKSQKPYQGVKDGLLFTSVLYITFAFPCPVFRCSGLLLLDINLTKRSSSLI